MELENSRRLSAYTESYFRNVIHFGLFNAISKINKLDEINLT